MAEHEAIFKGSAADFVRFVDDFESRRDFNSSTVFHLPRYLPDSSRGFVHIYPPDSDGEGMIEAYSLPGERSILVCWTHEDTWSEIEPYWRDLLAELQRFGLIEEPKPKRGGGSVPEKLEERARCVFEWEEARASQPSLSGEAFVASRKDVYATGSSLYRWRQDPEVQDYIERHYRSSAINEP